MSDFGGDDWNDPLGRVSDARTARLLGNVLIQAQEQRWTPELVQARLKEMANVVERIVHRPGPRMKSTLWPADMVREWGDAVAQASGGKLAAAPTIRGAARLGADDHEISRAEQAIGWIPRYLAGDAHDDARDVLQAWLTCESGPETWERASVAVAGSKKTANRRRRRACEIICHGLVNDKVLP